MADDFTLTVTCPASSGIVAAVTTYLFDRGCYLSELHQFDDECSRRFFLRAVDRVTEGDSTLETLEAGFPTVAENTLSRCAPWKPSTL